MGMDNYTKIYEWKAIDEVKGWENPNLRDTLHKVTVEEHETGQNNKQTFNFNPSQTKTDRWKRHVDNWIEKLQNTDKPDSVL